MAGYSGTPLPKKLGIKEGFRVFLLDSPADVATELKDALKACELMKEPRVPLDFAMIFVKNTRELQKKLEKVAKELAPAGMLWISWPKKASGLQTEMNENDVRRIGLENGLVDVKVCAVNEVWSGLKFVIPVKNRIKK